MTTKKQADSLVNQANQKLKDKKYEEALKNYKKALEVYQGLGDPEKANLAVTYNNIGVTQYHLEQYLDAINSLQKSLTIHESLNLTKQKGDAIANMAWVYENLAFKFYQQAITTYKTIGSSKDEAARKPIRDIMCNLFLEKQLAEKPGDYFNSDQCDMGEDGSASTPPKVGNPN